MCITKSGHDPVKGDGRFFFVGEPPPGHSVANEGFAPLCGAAAISMAALKAPVASERRGATKADKRR